jgi:hypothetical protein
MPIKVHFRGPMLFVTDSQSSDVVDRILIPDSTALRKHPDGSDAIPHDAGLLLIDGRREVYMPLAGRKVTIDATGEKGRPKITADFLGVPPLTEMTNSSEATPPSVPMRRRSAPDGEPTTVEITGGRMSGEMKIDKTKVELLRHNAPPLPWEITTMPTWVSDATKGTITLTGGHRKDETIELGPGVSVYIYNWDIPFPRQDQLTAMRTETDEITDLDFKFVYTLLKPTGQTWQEWLGGAGQLPSPRLKEFDSHFGFTPATCNSARITGVAIE